ncbi:MAG TPA: SCO family protein [Hyphomicrobium sp.]|jgi:protein SCO1/2|nr:SCO family protein [Hyphomicrobium sp.]
MAARSIIIGIAGAALGLAAAVALLPQVRERLFPSVERQVSGKALIGGAFTLTDSTGKRVTEQSFRGKYMLLFFGYTSCPDICPAGLQLMAGALEKLGPKAERITPVFISVDPERDTPEKLAGYVKNFDPRLVGLTGTPEEIAAVAKAYKVYYAKTPSKEHPDDYTMDHTSIIYVMDPNGEFVTHFTPATSVDEMAAKLGKIL